MLSPSELYGPWEVEGYQVQIDFTDGARLVASRDGRRLAALPTTVRASGDMAWIRLAHEAAQRHIGELKKLLENAMVEQIPLSAQDLAALALDPAGRSMLGRLLLNVDRTIGCVVPDQWLLEASDGSFRPLGAPAKVVHPIQLERNGTLARWNGWLNRVPFSQPLKQIRREIYRPNARDCETPGCTARVAGERVRWDQARALLEGRGWYRVTKRGAERAFRGTRLTAHLEFRNPVARGFGKEDVLLGRIFVLPAGETPVNRGRPGLPLEQIPAIVFSEAVRDVMLVANVAARPLPL